MKGNSPPKKRSPGRPPSGGDTEIARDDLLRAALRSFAEQGYEGMSMRRLAERLGISHGLLNQRFGTKQQLWEVSVEFGLEKFRQRMLKLPRDGSLEERFKAAVMQILEAIRAVPEMLLISNLEGSTKSARLDHIAETILTERYARLQEVVTEGVRTGELVPTPPHLLTVLVTHGGGVLFAMQPLAFKLGLLEKGDKRELNARAGEIADLVWRAVRRTNEEG